MVGTADPHSHRGDPPDFSGRPALRGVLLDVPQNRGQGHADRLTACSPSSNSPADFLGAAAVASVTAPAPSAFLLRCSVHEVHHGIRSSRSHRGSGC